MNWKQDKISNVLSKGLQGSKVELLQSMLNELNGRDITVDGYFGEETRVRVAQVKRNLGLKGYSGRIDISVLMNIILAVKTNQSKSSILTPALQSEVVKQLTPRINSITGKKFLPIERIDIIDKLPRKNRVKQLNPKNVLGIVCHHSYTNPLSGGSTPFGFADYHVLELKWPCIAYDMVVDLVNNIIYKTASLKDLNWHTGGLNSKYYGICIIGNYDVQKMTSQAYHIVAEAFEDIYNEQRELYVKDWIPELRFHNEFSSKTCPGTNFLKRPLADYLTASNVEFKIV